MRLADGFLVSTPEYAHGVPGTLKNALDWLVGTDAFIEKPFALLHACDRSTFAPQSLIEILTTMSGLHVARLGTVLLYEIIAPKNQQSQQPSPTPYPLPKLQWVVEQV